MDIPALKDIPLIGTGATSQVYDYGEDKVLKLFTHNFDRDAVAYEANIAAIVAKSVSVAPQFHGVVQYQDRHGILYEKINGELAFTALLRDISQAPAIIRQLCACQNRLHALVNTELPSQLDRLTYLIARTNISDKIKTKIRDYLASQTAATNLCHGDFHVGNIFIHEGQVKVIDWMNAYGGNAVGDVVRSYLMLASPFIPLKLSPPKALQFRILKYRLAKLYLREYLKICPIAKRDFRQWIPAIAAARIADNVPGEYHWLVRLINKNLKYLRRNPHGV